VKGAGAIAGNRKIWEPAVVIASALYAVVFAWPASVQPAAWVWGSHGDGLGNIVEFSWFVQAIKQGLSWNVDPNLSVPFGEALGGQPHEPLYFWAQIGIGLVAGSVVALNLLSLLALPAAAWAMFRLVYWLMHSPVAAFVSGIGFGCCSYIIANTGGEPTLAQIWVFPATILAMLKLLDRPSARTILVAAGVVTIASMVNFYYVLFVALSLSVAGASWVAFRIFERHAVPVRSVLAGVASGFLAVVATIAIYEVSVGHLSERASLIHRTATTLSLLAASPIDFLLPPTTNPWLGGWRQQVFELRLLRHPGIYTDFSELAIALPILILGVVGLAIVLLPRFRSLREAVVERVQVIAIIGIALLGVWLLVPPFGRRYHLTFLSLEYDIWSVAPQYASFYRAGLLVVLAACVLAGVAMAALALRRPQAAIAVALVAVLGIFVENFTVAPDRVLAVQPLPEYTWLDAHPGDYAVAEYPLLPPGSGANEYTSEFYQRFHGHPLVNGSILDTDAESMREEFRDPNRSGVADALAAIGVRYIVWRPDVIRQFAPINPAYAALLYWYQPQAPGYRLAGSFSDGSKIFAINASGIAPFAFYASGFGPVGGTWARTAESANGRIDVFSPSAGATNVNVSFTCGSTDVPVTLSAGGRDYTLTPGQDVVVVIAIAARHGMTTAPLAVSPDSAAEQGGVSCGPISVSH